MPGKAHLDAYIDHPSAPWQNGYVESFNARFRDEVLDIEEFSCLEEARFLANEWFEDYNEEHPHSALGMMAPTSHLPRLLISMRGKTTKTTSSEYSRRAMAE